MASDDLMSAYLAGNLDTAAKEAFEQEMLANPEIRAELLGQRRISAGLHALLGDSSGIQRAVISTLKSDSEELAIARIVGATVRVGREVLPHDSAKGELNAIWSVPGLVRGLWKAAAVIAAAATCAALLQLPRKSAPVASIRDAVGAEWKAVQPDRATGELRRGYFELSHGIAELEFRSGARVVIESPAKLQLLNSNELELTSGRIAAFVPPPATGFTVRTSAGDIVDIGTRFGVDAMPGKSAAVHVLEGRVQVQGLRGHGEALSEGDAVTLQDVTGQEIVRSVFSPDSFPRAAQQLGGFLIAGDFEESNLVAIDSAPRQFGLWSGDPALVVPTIDGIQPHSGEKMLRFDIPQRGKPAPSRQWQLVDVRPIRKAAGGAKAEATFRVWFNRASTAVLNPNFTVTLAAFKGDPSQAPHFWAARQDKALAISEAYIRTDMNPGSWEKAETSISVPPDADFLLVQMAANQPHGPELGGSGHYADDAELEVRIGPRAAITPLAAR